MAKKALAPVAESLAIAVPPARAWQALTSPTELGRILFGRVELEPKPGAPFHWRWGLWEKLAPKKADYSWRGTVLDVVPGSTLVLGDSGQMGVVCFTVKGDPEASLVTVVQPSPAQPRLAEDYRHGWADFLLRFKTYLEFQPGKSDLLLRVLVRGTPADAIRAWLEPKQLAKILPGKASGKPKVGGKFLWEWRGRRDSGTYLEIERSSHIAFTWESTRLAGGRPSRPSEVRIAAGRAPYGTLVSLYHAGLTGADTASWQRFHEWHELLERLRCYLYFGKKIRVAA